MAFFARNTLVLTAGKSEFSVEVLMSRIPESSMETRKGSAVVRK
jgi:hypothetical protein